jgi:hypothetical protein
MSIAATPVVGPSGVRPSGAAATAWQIEGESSVESAFEPDASRARRLAWAAVILISCGFSYSIGWSKGWTVGAGEADARFEANNQSMLALPVAQAFRDATPEPSAAIDSVETATAADHRAGSDGGAGPL